MTSYPSHDITQIIKQHRSVPHKFIFTKITLRKR
nr:MAG TPA: hypothetical protein [Microviridae sp.]